MTTHELFFGPLVERLGWTLLHSLWEGVVVAAVLALALAALRRRSPQARYLAASVAMATILVLSLATFFVVRPTEVTAPSQARVVESPAETVPAPASGRVEDPLPLPAFPAPELQDAMTVTSAPPASATAEQALLSPLAAPPWSERFQQVAEPYLPWLVAAWFAGLLVLGVWRVGGWIATMRLRVVGVLPIGPEIEAIVRRLAGRLGLQKPIRVVQSLVVQTPMVIGWLRPVILLPLSAITGLTAAQLEAILSHELAHIRRNDYLINLLQTVVETLLFYHPVVWWISGHMRAERERCCDDVAVELSGDAIGYAEALAAVEETQATVWVAVAAGSPGGRDLIDRIRRVLGLPDHPRYAGALSAVATLAVLGIVALSMAFHVSAQIWAKDAWDSTPFGDTVAIGILHQRPGGQPATYRIDDQESLTKLLAALKITGIHNGIGESNIPSAFATFHKKDGSSLKVSIDNAEQLAGKQGHIYITSDFVEALNRQLTAKAGHAIDVLEFLPDTSPPAAPVPDASLRSLTAGFLSLDVNYLVGKKLHLTRIVDRKTLDEIHVAMGAVKQGPRDNPRPPSQWIQIASKDGSSFYARPLSEMELSEPKAGRFTVEPGFVRAIEAYLTKVEGRPIRLLEDNPLLAVQVERERKFRGLLADVQTITLSGPLFQCDRPLVIDKPAKAAELMKMLAEVQIPLQDREAAKEGSFVELAGRDGQKTRITWLKPSETVPEYASLLGGNLVEIPGFGQAWIDNQWQYRLRKYIAGLKREADDDRQLAITRAVAADLPKFLQTAISATVHYRENGEGTSVTILRDSVRPLLAALAVEKVEPLDWDKARWKTEVKGLIEREAGILQITPGTGYDLLLIVTGEREMLMPDYGRVLFKTSPLAAIKKALADGDVKPEAIELLPRPKMRGVVAAEVRALADSRTGEALDVMRPGVTNPGVLMIEKAAASLRTGSKLEFRIVPNGIGSSRTPLYPVFVDEGREHAKPEPFAPHALKELADLGPGPARQRGDPLQWFELTGEVTRPGTLIGEHKGAKYILLPTKPPYVMLPGTGKDAWAIEKAYATTDSVGRPVVSFELDARGAELFSALTKANGGNAMAILVDGKVVSAPEIRTALGRSGQIAGRFTQQQAEELANALAVGMAPVAAREQPAEKISWGEEVKGLQAGLSFDLQERAYRVGETVGFRIYVRNRSEKPLKLHDYVGANPPRDDALLIGWTPTVHDANGNRISGPTPVIDKPLSSRTREVAPGQTMFAGTVNLRIGRPVGSRDSYELAPGTYQVSQPYRFEKATDAAWSGELTTGELALRVVAAADQPAEKISWGEEVRGLQAGLSFDLQERAYRVGELVSFRLYLRHRGEHPIELVDSLITPRPGDVELFGWGLVPTVQDAAGKRATVVHPETSSRSHEAERKRRLEPGQTMLSGIVSLRIDCNPVGPHPFADLKPGTYQVSQIYASRIEREGTWSGELTTGKLALRIVAAEDRAGLPAVATEAVGEQPDADTKSAAPHNQYGVECRFVTKDKNGHETELTAPLITLLDRKKARLEVKQEIPVLVKTDRGADSLVVEHVPQGLTLEIGVTGTSDGKVTLDASIEISKKVNPAVSDAVKPNERAELIRVQSLKTRVIQSVLLDQKWATIIGGNDKEEWRAEFTVRKVQNALNEFGASKGEPINAGYLFVDGVYIDAPYMVDRRGLDIYVNGTMVRHGAAWPRPNLQVDADPGDPPSGVKPWDMPASGNIKDNYWSRKWRYLRQHMAHAEALKAIRSAYAKSDAFTAIEPGENEFLLVLTDKTGQKTPVDYRPSPMGTLDDMSKQELLDLHEGYRQFFEKVLRSDTMLVIVPGGEMHVSRSTAYKAMRILVSDKTPEQKLKELEQVPFFKPGDKSFHALVRNFKASPQLAQRLPREDRTRPTKPPDEKERQRVERLKKISAAEQRKLDEREWPKGTAEMLKRLNPEDVIKMQILKINSARDNRREYTGASFGVEHKEPVAAILAEIKRAKWLATGPRGELSILDHVLIVQPVEGEPFEIPYSAEFHASFASLDSPALKEMLFALSGGRTRISIIHMDGQEVKEVIHARAIAPHLGGMYSHTCDTELHCAAADGLRLHLKIRGPDRATLVDDEQPMRYGEAKVFASKGPGKYVVLLEKP